jgi:hypothetical protein
VDPTAADPCWNSSINRQTESASRNHPRCISIVINEVTVNHLAAICPVQQDFYRHGIGEDLHRSLKNHIQPVQQAATEELIESMK